MKAAEPIVRIGMAVAVAVAVATPWLHASDFAVEVVEYVPGIGIGFDWLSQAPFDDPTAALGRPTVDTTGDGWYIPANQAVPVLPVNPPFRAFEVVTVGVGGHLVLRFDHPVVDDPANPFGVDLIVFGNASQILGGGQGWTNGDPNEVTLGSGAIVERGIVSVSQDGERWFAFADGPYADDFAPTLGRTYSPQAPVSALGMWNRWWGEPTDPTKPLDPRLTPASLAGRTVADVAVAYGRSAGGTGFDLAVVGLPWIQYVRIDNPPGSGYTPEVDAIADAAPACPGGGWYVRADFDRDCDVDLADFTQLQGCFNGPNHPPAAECAAEADLDNDGDVDLVDFNVFQSCFGGPNRLPACG